MTPRPPPMKLALAEAEVAAARGDVPPLDPLAAVEIGERARHPQHPVVPPDAEPDSLVRLVEHGPCLFDRPTTRHRPEIYGGIEEGRAGELLRDFFRARR